MDETNRAIAIVVSLLLIFVALFIILLTWLAPDQSIDSIADLADYLNDNNEPATQLLITFAALIIALLGVTMIILQLMPESAGSVKVAKVGVGDARIGTDAIASQLETELRSISRLRNIEARVAARSSRADVHLNLLVDSEADVVEAASIAIQRTREIVEGRMGVELERPPRAEVHFSDQKSDRHVPVSAAPVAPSGFQPAATSMSTHPSPSSDPAASATEPVHEATQTAHEDRPAGA